MTTWWHLFRSRWWSIKEDAYRLLIIPWSAQSKFSWFLELCNQSLLHLQALPIKLYLWWCSLFADRCPGEGVLLWQDHQHPHVSYFSCILPSPREWNWSLVVVIIFLSPTTLMLHVGNCQNGEDGRIECRNNNNNTLLCFLWLLGLGMCHTSRSWIGYSLQHLLFRLFPFFGLSKNGSCPLRQVHCESFSKCMWFAVSFGGNLSPYVLSCWKENLEVFQVKIRGKQQLWLEESPGVPWGWGVIKKPVELTEVAS